MTRVTQHVTPPYLLLAALIAGTLDAGQAPVLGIRRGVCPVVEVEIEVVIVVVVEEAGRAAVQGAPFAFCWAAAVQTLAPHASRKLGALHGPERRPGGWGEKNNGVVTREWVPGFPRRHGTRSDRLLAAAVRSVGGPVSRLRWERIEGEKADLRKAGVSCTPVCLVPSWSGAGPLERGKALRTHRILTGGAAAADSYWLARARNVVG